MEKWISRCVLVRRAIYPPAAQAPPSAVAAPGKAAEGASAAAASNGGSLGAGPAAAAAVAAPSASEANGGGKAAGVNGKPRPRRAGSGGDVPAAAALIPTRARRLVWRGVVDALLLSLLRGFSRAKRCSTEGRALMSMDLQVIFSYVLRRGGEVGAWMTWGGQGGGTCWSCCPGREQSGTRVNGYVCEFWACAFFFVQFCTGRSRRLTQG